MQHRPSSLHASSPRNTCREDASQCAPCPDRCAAAGVAVEAVYYCTSASPSSVFLRIIGLSLLRLVSLLHPDIAALEPLVLMVCLSAALSSCLLEKKKREKNEKQHVVISIVLYPQLGKHCPLDPVRRMDVVGLCCLTL